MHTYDVNALRHTCCAHHCSWLLTVWCQCFDRKIKSAETLYFLRFGGLCENRLKQWLYKLLLYQCITFTLVENSYKQRNSWSKKNSYNEFPIRWNFSMVICFYTRKILYHEISERQKISLRRNFVKVKFPYGEISHGEIFSGKVS